MANRSKRKVFVEIMGDFEAVIKPGVLEISWQHCGEYDKDWQESKKELALDLGIFFHCKCIVHDNVRQKHGNTLHVGSWAREKIVEMYVVSKRSIDRISDETGFSSPVVNRTLREEGIDVSGIGKSRRGRKRKGSQCT